ncbi:MAG: SpoIIE family protein phosphatase [Nocardioidaceae bacterium]
MGTTEHAAHQFAPQATSAQAARRFVRQTLAGWGADSVLDDAVLLTSELVTNAIVHAGTPVRVACALGSSYVQVGVSDGHASRTLPTPVGPVSRERESGRGLYLVAQLAASWGIEYEPVGKRVWFRLPLSPAARPSVSSDQPEHSIDLGRAETPVRVAVVETEPSGVVRHWSLEARELFGWTTEDMLGHQLGDLVTGLPGAQPGSAFADLLTLPRWSGDCLVRDKAGNEIPVFASHILATAGEQPRVVCLIVSAQQRAVLMPGTADSATAPEPFPVPARPGLLSLEALLDLTTEHSRDLLDGDAAYVLLVTDDDLDVELRATAGLASPGTTSTRRWPKPQALTGPAGGIPEPMVYADIATEDVLEKFLTDAGMHALVATPLLVGERVIGIVGVASHRPGAYTVDEAERLRRSVDRFSLAIEDARLNEAERARRGRLSYLAEASELLAGVLDPEMAAALTAQLVVPRLADWCAVYLLDQRRTPRLTCVWHAHERDIDPLRRLLERLGSPPLDETGRPRQWPELSELVAAGSPADIDVGSGPAVIVTLHARGRVIGTLVAGRGAGHDFRTGAIDTLDDLCRRAAWAIHNARLYDDRSMISEALQRSLLPLALPTIPGVEVGLGYEAAGEGIDVGGDFYDLFDIAENHWGFVIGDVCGKGPEAAAVAGLARHSVRVLARERHPIPHILRRLNETIIGEGEAARFVTLIYGEMQPAPGGDLLVTFAVAGHPLPLLVARDGHLQTMGRPQPLLGVLPSVRFHTDALRLRRGEHLVCTTDGVTDRRAAGRTLGERGVHELLRRSAALPAPAIASRIRRAVLDFGDEPLQDDIAVLVIQPVGSRPDLGADPDVA